MNAAELHEDYTSHPDLAPYVERFVLDGQSARLSSAALETLAIVAYKQPLSRAQVAAIRGVNVDGVMRTLQQRGYVEEVGRDSGPGQATLFGTTREFLERLGLDSLQDLPPIADLFPSADVMEALEKGLRVEPAEPADAGDEGGEPASAPTDSSPPDGDDVVVDLHDGIDELDLPAWFHVGPPNDTTPEDATADETAPDEMPPDEPRSDG